MQFSLPLLYHISVSFMGW